MPELPKAASLGLVCPHCAGTCERTATPRFGVGVWVLGGFLWFAAVILGLNAITTYMDPGGYSTAGQSFGAAFFIAAPICVIAGTVFLSRRRVWQCQTCDSIFERGGDD